MTKTITIVLAMFICTCGHADAINGKKLFEKAKCMECHDVADFKDKNVRKSKTFAQLKGRVSACQITHDAHRFDEDEHDVALYLNKEYFHFKEKE